MDDLTQAGSDLGQAAEAVGGAASDAFVWADKNLNPMYYAVEGYAKEIDAYESGCGYWNSVKYGAIGTAETAASTAAWFGPAKVVELVGPGARLTGKASWLFGRLKFGQQGTLNRGFVRMGWGWKGPNIGGQDVFRIAFGNRGSWFHGHMDF